MAFDNRVDRRSREPLSAAIGVFAVAHRRDSAIAPQ
jgi:hypothetical protein